MKLREVSIQFDVKFTLTSDNQIIFDERSNQMGHQLKLLYGDDFARVGPIQQIQKPKSEVAASNSSIF